MAQRFAKPYPPEYRAGGLESTFWVRVERSGRRPAFRIGNAVLVVVSTLPWSSRFRQRGGARPLPNHELGVTKCRSGALVATE